MQKNSIKLYEHENSNIVYRYVKEKVLTLALAPGAKISENKLAAELEVSRTVVREAFSTLEEEGYIEIYPQKGTFVSKINMERIRQAVTAHNVFEQAIVKELCDLGFSEEQEEQLTELLYGENYPGDDDIVEIIKIEQYLQYLLAKFCGKEYVWNVYRVMDCDLFRIYYLQYSTFSYRSFTHSLTGKEYAQVEGRMMVDSIRRREKDAAALVCANRLNMILMNAESLQKIYPAYFAEEKNVNDSAESIE